MRHIDIDMMTTQELAEALKAEDCMGIEFRGNCYAIEVNHLLIWVDSPHDHYSEEQISSTWDQNAGRADALDYALKNLVENDEQAHKAADHLAATLTVLFVGLVWLGDEDTGNIKAGNIYQMDLPGRFPDDEQTTH